MQLKDRTCLLIGGTGGIGRATARRFLREGARVVVSGRTVDETDEACRALAPFGEIVGFAADVSHESEVEDLFARVRTVFETRLDVLVHIAGRSGRSLGDGPLHSCTANGWDALMETNARGAFLTNRAAVRRMLTQNTDDVGGRGAILNVGSVLAFAPSAAYFDTAAYAASKGAIQSLTLACAARYAASGIRFNLLAPGLIATPMSQRATNDPRIQHFLVTKQPVAAGPGSPEDCAEAALFLCQPASHFITGVVLPVDGGWRFSDGQIAPESENT